MIRAFALALTFLLFATGAQAVTIDKIVSPSGLEAWLVRDKSGPLVALSYSFDGGTSQDAPEKSGAANLAANMLDEGAGDLDARAFQERLESHAIELGFSASRDNFGGTVRTLTDHADEAFDLLGLALKSPRFDGAALERVRGQTLSTLRREMVSPGDLSGRRFWRAAFPNHPYSQEGKGTLETLPGIVPADLRDYLRRVLARKDLKIAIVGDVDAKKAGELIDRAFGWLPANNDLRPVPKADIAALGKTLVVDVDVPQAVVTYGAPGLQRSDPDFMAAYLVNHILGGGTFSSRLYREVREKRGLAYGISNSLVWLKGAALTIGSTATRADRTGEALDIIQREVKRMADEGPTAEELASAKAYVKGSYALAFDTSSKIAGMLVQIQRDNLGLDYIKKRDSLIDAVTLEDTKRAAKRLLGGGLLVTVAGRPKGVTATE